MKSLKAQKYSFNLIYKHLSWAASENSSKCLFFLRLAAQDSYVSDVSRKNQFHIIWRKIIYVNREKEEINLLFLFTWIRHVSNPKPYWKHGKQKYYVKCILYPLISLYLITAQHKEESKLVLKVYKIYHWILYLYCINKIKYFRFRLCPTN